MEAAPHAARLALAEGVGGAMINPELSERMRELGRKGGKAKAANAAARAKAANAGSQQAPLRSGEKKAGDEASGVSSAASGRRGIRWPIEGYSDTEIAKAALRWELLEATDNKGYARVAAARALIGLTEEAAKPERTGKKIAFVRRLPGTKPELVEIDGTIIPSEGLLDEDGNLLVDDPSYTFFHVVPDSDVLRLDEDEGVDEGQAPTRAERELAQEMGLNGAR